MTYDPNRYILGTWGEFVEVERRPLIAPGTKPLTKQQLAERRAARKVQRVKVEHQLLGQGWGWDQMTQVLTHTSGARITRLECEQNSAEGLLEMAGMRVAEAQARSVPWTPNPPAAPQRARTAPEVAALPLIRGIKDLRVHQHGDYVTLVLQHSVGGSTAALSADTLSAPDEVFNSRLASTVEGLLTAKRKAEYDDWLARMSQKQAGIQQALLRPNPLLNPHPGAQQVIFGTPASPHTFIPVATERPGAGIQYFQVGGASYSATNNLGTLAAPNYVTLTNDC